MTRLQRERERERERERAGCYIVILAAYLIDRYLNHNLSLYLPVRSGSLSHVVYSLKAYCQQIKAKNIADNFQEIST